MAEEPHLTAERPFPGLRPFDFADREFFFGREDQIYALYRLLDLSRFIAVIGSSGSGKSSLVRAGLLPLIDDEAHGSGGRDWRSTTFHPGDAPMSSLANALTALIPESETEGPADREIRRARIEFALRRSSFGLADALAEIPSLQDKPLLIVVDQFEELFRYATTATRSMQERVSDSLWRDEASNFVQLLLEGSRDRARSVTVSLTMRSDFIGDCAMFQGLPEAVSSAQFLVPSLTRDQREAVIKQPVEAAGATIEPALVERLLNDASNEIDQLPVLQHALLRLWDRAGKGLKPGQARRLTLDHYRKIGQIAGALSQHANEVLHELPGLEVGVEQVFRALSEVDKEGRATRRALPYKQLLAETGVPDDQLRRILDRFRADDCSFLVPSLAAVPVLREDTRIDVVHEALLRRWNLISAPATEGLGGKAEGWLAAEDRDGRSYRALLTLLEGATAAELVTLPLALVQDRWKWWSSRPRTEAWAERYGGKLTRVNQLFTDSLAALKAEELRQAEAQRREREEERRKIEAAEAEKRMRLEHEAAVAGMRAEAAHRLTRRTRVAALAMSAVAVVALALGAYAWREQAQVKAQYEDLQVAQKKMQESEAGRSAAEQQAREADKRRLTDTTRLLGIARKAQQATEIALQQAKSALAEAQRQRTIAQNQQRIAENETNVARQQTNRAQAATAEAVTRRAALFSQAGREALLSGDDDNAAVLLAAAYGDDPKNSATRLTLGQALQKLAIRGGSFTAHDGLITVIQFNPRNPRQMATAGVDGVKLYDTSGRLLHVFNDQSDLITSLAFDPSGRYLATAARDGTAKIRDLRGVRRDYAPAPVVLAGHLRRINSIVFNHDGSRVLTAGGDGLVKLWNARSGAAISLDFAKLNDPINAAVFAGGDREIVLCASDGSLRVIDATTGKELASVQTSTKSPLVTLAVSDGARVIAATGAADGGVLLYDVGGQHLIKERHDHAGGINALAFDPAGRHVVTASDDGTARVLDAATGDITATLVPKAATAGTVELPSAVLNAVFSPNGEVIATTYKDGTVALWTSDGTVLARLRGHQGATEAAAFTPDGDLLATGGSDGKVFLWHAGELGHADASHKEGIESIAFTRDGSRMVTASRDGTAALWHVGEGLTRERSLPHAPGTAWVTTARFSVDGKRVVTAGGDRVKVWNADGSGSSQPLAVISPTAPQKRFSDATFVGAGDDVMVAQRSINEARNYYSYDKWIEWSADGKRRLTDEPSWQRDISQVELSSNGHFALAVSGTGYATFSWIDARYTYNTWDSVAQAVLANQHFFYALGFADGSLEIVSLTGVKLKGFAAHQGRVSALAFSHDDRWLASAGSGDLVGKIWDVGSGKLHATLSGHTGEIRSIAFAPNGAPLVLTTSADGTAKLWDRDTGDLLASNSVPGSSVSVAEFTPSGGDVVLGAADGDLQLWRLGGSLPRPRAAAHVALAAIQSSGASVTNPLLHQAEDEVTTVAGETSTMARRAESERVRGALVALNGNEPTHAASDLVPAFIANPADPSLRLAVSALASRFVALRATLTANSERIEHLAFVADSTKLVTTSFDKTARVWDPRSGRLLSTLGGFDSMVVFLATQPHGNLAAAAALGDSAVRVWDVSTGRERYKLSMGSAVRRIVFSRDGSKAVGFGQNGIVRVWDANTGRELREFTGAAVLSVSVSSSGDIVAVGTTDGDVTFYNVGTGKRAGSIDVFSSGDRESISRIELHTRLPYLLSTQKNTVRIWTRTGKLVRTLQYSGQMTWAGFAEQSDVVAATGDSGPMIWRNGRAIALVAPGVAGEDRGGLFRDGDHRFFSIGSQRSVAMWDTASGKLLAQFPATDSDYMDADASEDAKLLATAGNDGLIHVWDAAAGTPSGTRFNQSGSVAGLQADQAGRRVLIAAADGTAKVWNAATASVLWARKFGTAAQGTHLRIASDGESLVVSSRPAGPNSSRSHLAILSALDGRIVRQYDIQGIAQADPAGRLAAWLDGNEVRLLDLHSGRRWSWRAQGAQSVAFATAGDLLVTQDQNGAARVWRSDGTQVVALTGAKGAVGVASNAAGRRFVTFGPGIDTTLWDDLGSRRRPVAILAGGSGDVDGADVAADGRVLTASTDGTLHVWSSRGVALATLGGATHLTYAAFSRNGRFVVAIADDGTASIWDDGAAELVSFPTHTDLPIPPQSSGDLNVLVADGNGVMLYRLGATFSVEAARSLARRLRLVPGQPSTKLASAHR